MRQYPRAISGKVVRPCDPVSPWTGGWPGAHRSRDEEAARPHRPTNPPRRRAVHHRAGPVVRHRTAWRPQVALLINEPTLLPVLMPLTPAATLPARTARHIAATLATHATPKAVIEQELRHMRDYRVATTANRSIVGIMNEFSRLAEVHRDRDPYPNLTDLAQRLATTPCSPLYGRNVSPDANWPHSCTPPRPPAGSSCPQH